MSIITRSAIEARLSSTGLEMTPQRFAVLEYLARKQDPATAEQIATALLRGYPRPSRAMILGTLKTLRNAGIVTEMFRETDALYEVNTDLNDQFAAAEIEED
jgi:Fur family peroxide stress response transcriptional regulator